MVSQIDHAAVLDVFGAFQELIADDLQGISIVAVLEFPCQIALEIPGIIVVEAA